MNNDWKLKEIAEEVRSLKAMYSKGIERCKEQAEEYKDVYNTFDKFEATKNEYWRSRACAFGELVDDLNVLLETINDIIDDKPKNGNLVKTLKGMNYHGR